VQLVDFTSFEDIRAALGVSAEEIKDATLSLPLYVNRLRMDLESVSASTLTLHATLANVQPASQTEQQARFEIALQLFATYSVAKHLTISLPLFSPREITDGKASLSRYAQDPYRATIARVESEYDTLRQNLAAALAGAESVSAPTVSLRPWFSAVTPTPDPVTGV